MADKLKINDLVWAKMKGFAPWPGRIAMPPPTCKKPQKVKGPHHCIFFFGTDNYAWIEHSKITPYLEYKHQFGRTTKPGLKEAIAAIEEYIRKAEDGIIPEERQEEAFDRLKESSLDESTDVSKISKPKKIAKERKRKEKDINSSTPMKKRLVDSNALGQSNFFNDSSPVSVEAPVVRKSAAAQFLDRPSATAAVAVPTEELDVSSMSQTLRSKNITASHLKFGFLGLGFMGSGMVKNLINSGHDVVVWNRSADKCEKFVAAGAKTALTPSDVIDMCDITFSCLSDPVASKEIVFGNCGVMASMKAGKAYVEMTGIDPETSSHNADTITAAGGRYLEAQIQGSKLEAEEGSLVVVAAGERNLFDECQSCFEAISNHSFFVGEVGNASKMNMILNMIKGISLAALAEGMALADRSSVQQSDILEVFSLTKQASPFLIEKAKVIEDGRFPTSQALRLMQKDLRLAMELGDMKGLPLPLCATTNEVYKHAKRLGYAEHDVSAVYIRARF